MSEKDFLKKEFGTDIDEEQSIINRMPFLISYSLKDIFRRKILFLIAFSAVFVCIFCTLLIDVFVKKGSLIFVKMSEDLQIDAVVYPSMIKESIDNDQTTEPNPFRLNYTRIKELQDIK